MLRPAPDRPSDLRRQAARARALTLHGRLSRLYAIVDAAERRAAQRHREVQELCASAQLLCERSVRFGRGPAVEPEPDNRAAAP